MERPGFLDGFFNTTLRVRDHIREAGLLGDRWAYFGLETVSERRELRGDEE